MNPIFRFVYLNMNYHTEHHMYPMVPYYKLPELHRELRHDLPPPYRGTLAAYREIIPALLRQRKRSQLFRAPHSAVGGRIRAGRGRHDGPASGAVL